MLSRALKCARMDFSTWLDAESGRLTALAQHFRLTQSAVSQWRTNGVPLNRMKAVRDFTDGAVSLDEMVPDPTWPHPLGRPAIDVAAPQEGERAAA